MSNDELKAQAEADRAFANLAESHPPMLRRYFTNLVSQGFTEQQALELTKQLILAFFSGIKP